MDLTNSEQIPATKSYALRKTGANASAAKLAVITTTPAPPIAHLTPTASPTTPIAMLAQPAEPDGEHPPSNDTASHVVRHVGL